MRRRHLSSRLTTATFFLVEQRILFEFREPTPEELGELGDVGDNSVPWATLPWLRRGDYNIQLDFTLSNLSTDTGVTVAVVLNGINEFHEYNPGVQIIDDELVADFSGWEHTYELGPGERAIGTVRQEEIDEITVDLSSVVNNAPNPNQLVYFDNHSTLDPRSQMYIPDVVAALTGLRLGLRSESTDRVLLEATVRITDYRGVLVATGEMPWVAPQPALFGPADAAPPAMP